jgi:hypothetical protein
MIGPFQAAVFNLTSPQLTHHLLSTSHLFSQQDDEYQDNEISFGIVDNHNTFDSYRYHTMQITSLFVFSVLLLLGFAGLGEALITLETIRNLTSTTDECRGRITALGTVQEVDPMARALGGVSQVVVSGGAGGGDEEEVEVVSSKFSFHRFFCL